MSKLTIYGKHPFFSILKLKKRKIYSIYLAKQNRSEFESFVKKEQINLNGLPINFVENSKLNGMILAKEKNHQGYLIIVDERPKLAFDDFLNDAKKEKELPKLLILDQIVDPHNFGAILRTAIAFNIFNVIITSFNSAKETSTILKTSVGLSELINIIEIVNLNNVIRDLKNIGYFIFGFDGEGKKNLTEIKDVSNIAIIFGNEGKGIRELVKKNCDELIKINMGKHAESLNVSVAVGIALYKLYGDKLSSD
jgi:23S rRNA (guanosine2251-2'-O)-methyltransferase